MITPKGDPGGFEVLMDWLKKAPTTLVVGVLVVAAVATVAYLGGYVYLASQGVDTTEYRALLNTAFNYLTVLFGATTSVASVAAARSAGKAEEQTNGHLTARDETITDQAAEIERLRTLLAGGFRAGGSV